MLQTSETEITPQLEENKDENNNQTEDKKEKKGTIKRIFKSQKLFIFLRLIYLILNSSEVGIGGLVILFSLIGIFISTSLAMIGLRMVLCGIAMVFQGLFGTVFSSFCCCCMNINAHCLRMSFLSSFTTTFELFLFGGAYLFFEKGWISKAIVTGNKSHIFKMTLEKGGDINSLITRHFSFLRIAAVLCIIGFVIVALCCIFSIILLKPEYYMKQIPFIEDQIICICGSEFIFLGAFFKVLDIYSESPGSFLTSIIIIGVVIDWAFIAITVLIFCCVKWKHILLLVRIFLVVIVALICFIYAIIFLANMKKYSENSKIDIRAHCTAGLSEDPTQQYENKYNNEIYGYLNEGLLRKEDLKSIDSKLKTSSLSEFIKDHLSSDSGATKHIHSSSFIELQKIQMNENNNNDQSIFSLEKQQIADDIQIKNVDSGADKCTTFIPKIESVYGCNLENITVSGREQVCSDILGATVEKMSNFADVVNKIMVFAFFMIVVYVIIALFFTRISEYLLKIWHDAKEQTKKSTELEEAQESKENQSNKEKEKEMKEKSIENENKW